LIERQAARLRRLADSGLECEDIAGPSPQCDLCAVQSENERKMIRVIAGALNAQSDEPLRCPELCLPHLGALAELVESPDVLAALLSTEAGILENVAEDMHRYVLKLDAVRRPLLSADEDAAARHALALIAGKGGLGMRGRRGDATESSASDGL